MWLKGERFKVERYKEIERSIITNYRKKYGQNLLKE